MRKGRPLTPLLIAVGDRAQLVAWSKRPKTAQALAMRARIVLLAADGLSNTAIASQLRTMQHTVGKWRRRYLESGLDGLVDEPRPGTSNKLSDQAVERVLALTLESTPTDATHWSTRSMAKRAGLSRASIHRIWQAFSLAPHRSETFKLSKDPLFIDKVRDIVGLYLAPPERALVLCVDEKSQIQALDRTAPLLPAYRHLIRLSRWRLEPLFVLAVACFSPLFVLAVACFSPLFVLAVLGCHPRRGSASAVAVACSCCHPERSLAHFCPDLLQPSQQALFRPANRRSCRFLSSPPNPQE